MSKASKFDFLNKERDSETAKAEDTSSGADKKQQANEFSDTQNANNSNIQRTEASSINGSEDRSQKRRGRPAGKRSNPDYEQVTAYIRKDTHKKTKRALIDDTEARDFSTLVDELLTEWLTKQ